jgi:hypothetical protein
MNEARDKRDRIGEALRREFFGLTRPLWADMMEGQREHWRVHADTFMRLLADLGLSIEETP